MKLLHTSDWHLGASLGRWPRGPDHLEAIRGLLDIADDTAPDLIVHTGDLFDGIRPPYEALELGVRALKRLSEIAPTVVLQGNHDSARLFRVLHAMAGLAPQRRLHLVHEPQVLTFDVADQRVALVCVPFLKPGTAVDLADTPIESFSGSYADGVRDLIGQLLDAADAEGNVTVFAAHLHVDGAKPGRSERKFTVGPDYATRPTGLGRAAYAAFGHIHDTQLLPAGIGANGRYAGSLIPVDFGEATQTKSAITVSIGHDVVVRTHDLPGGRPLTHVVGTVEEVLARAADGGLNGHLLKAEVSSDHQVRDLADQILAASPDCCIFNLVNDVAHRKATLAEDSDTGEGDDLAAQFLEWRQTQATLKHRRAPDDDVLEMLQLALGSGDDGLPVAGVEGRARAALGEAS